MGSQILVMKTDCKRSGKQKDTARSVLSKDRVFYPPPIFSSCFLGSVPSGGGDRACHGSGRTRGHRKARVTFGRSPELFNPEHKTTWLTQNGIPFQMSPCCCLFPCGVYLTVFTACPKTLHAANMWRRISGAQQNNNCNFPKDGPTTSKSHQHTQNPIRRG